MERTKFPPPPLCGIKKGYFTSLTEAYVASEELLTLRKKKMIDKVIEHYIILPFGEKWVCKELGNRETFLFCYE